MINRRPEIFKLTNEIIGNVQAGIILLIIGGIATFLYDQFKSRTILDVKLAFVGIGEPIRTMEEATNIKFMVYPFQVKVINTGNTPITVTEIAPHHFINVDGKLYAHPSIYKKQEPYDESEIAANSSKTFGVRAFIEEEVITGNNLVNIEADLKIQGAGFTEKKAGVFAFQVDSNGKPIKYNKKRVISKFK